MVMVDGMTLLMVPVDDNHVGGICVVFHVCRDRVRPQIVAMNMHLGQCRTSMYLAPYPRRERNYTLAPHVAYDLMTSTGALTSPHTLTCS
jgi:hypothetical protein